MAIKVIVFMYSYYYPNQVQHSEHSRRVELRTQKLKSHLLGTQSLKILPLKLGVGQYIALFTKAKEVANNKPIGCGLKATPQWGAADAEMKILSHENAEFKRSPFKA